MTTLPQNALLVSNIHEQNVYDPQENKIGEVKDLVLDRSGKVTVAIISVGGFLGMGEKLAVPLPRTIPVGAWSDASASTPPYTTYTWDTGDAFVTLTAVGGDRERFGTVAGALDDLARSLRISSDVPVAGGGDVLRLDPS